MFDSALVSAVIALLSMKLSELLTLVAAILAGASATVKMTRSRFETLIFSLWGVFVLILLLAYRYRVEESSLTTFVSANGWLPTVGLFAAVGVVFGAMASGLWRVFFRPRTRTLYLYQSTSYRPWRVAWSGRRDGRDAVNARHFEESLVHFAEQNANLIAQTWNEADKKLKATFRSASTRAEATAAELEEARSALVRPKEDVAHEEERFKTTYSIHHLGGFGYWCIIVLIGVAEFPFNLTAMRSILGENELINAFFSLVVSGIFAFAIHSLGQFFAEDPFEKGLRRVLMKNPVPLVSLGFLLAVIVGFARFRESYIASFQKQLSGYGMTFDISPKTASAILGVVVTFFAVLAIDIGRRRYRPDLSERRTALTSAHRRLRRARRTVTWVEFWHHRRQKTLFRRRSERQGEFEFLREAAETINQKTLELIKIYRINYERAARRKRPGVEVAFDTPPTLSLPPALRTLDEGEDAKAV